MTTSLRPSNRAAARTRKPERPLGLRPVRLAIRLVVGALVVGLWVVCAACTSSQAIRPQELPQLNQAFDEDHAEDNPYAGHQVRTPDGEWYSVDGPFDVRVQMGATEQTFVHPVVSEIEGGVLVISGGGQAPEEFSMRHVSGVELVETDWVLTGVVAGSAGAGALLLAILLGLLAQ